MTLWLAMAMMTAAAIFAVLWPLSRRPVARSGGDLAVYRDQLEEIDRDCAAERIGEAEAAAARTEVARRLLAAADAASAEAAPPPGGRWRRRAAAAAALIGVPLVTGNLYLALGSPYLPSAPLGARLQQAPERDSLVSLVAQVEAHLARNPDEGRGWEVLAPVYLRLGRFEEAVQARRNALRLLGASAEREADLGEALVGAANGIVTVDAKSTFQRALALDAGEVKARFFLGLAAEQDGRNAEAAATWRALLNGAPPDAPWTELVRRSLARVDATAAAGPAGPGPTAQDIAAAEDMPPEQRTAMVRGMVERLAERLKNDGSDVEGWLRLVRAYTVLGERDKARAAASDARRALAPEPDKIRRIDDLVKGLGL